MIIWMHSRSEIASLLVSTNLSVSATLERLGQQRPFPARPPPADGGENLFDASDLDQTLLVHRLHAAVQFLAGGAPDEYADEAEICISNADEARQILVDACLSGNAGCEEVLNLFVWPDLLLQLQQQALGDSACVGNLLRTALRQQAFEQAFELAEISVRNFRSLPDSEKQLLVHIGLPKLARWGNFVRRDLLANFLATFATILTDPALTAQLHSLDPQAKWLRHWLAQTRVRQLLSNP